MEIIFIATLMETAIVVILLAILLIGSQLISGKYGTHKRLRKKQYINGIEAKAIVLVIEQTGLFMNHKPQVKMQMQVIPDKGRNFVAEVKEILSFIDLEAIKAGCTVTVKYNPTNIKEIMLVKAA